MSSRASQREQRRLRVGALLVLFSSISLPALAGESSDAGADAAPEDTREDARAAELFREAEARYVAGDIAGALALMQESYELSRRTELLFNLGELHRELHHCREAARSYREYLKAGRGTRQDEARRFSEELERECPEPKPPAVPATVIEPPATAVPAPPAVQPTRPYWTPYRIAGWSAVGASVAAAVGSAYFAGVAANRQADLESRIDEAQADGSPGFSAADKQLEEDGQQAARWARAFGFGALGFATVGVSLLLFHPSGTEQKLPVASVEWNGHGASATWKTSF